MAKIIMAIGLGTQKAKELPGCRVLLGAEARGHIGQLMRAARPTWARLLACVLASQRHLFQQLVVITTSATLIFVMVLVHQMALPTAWHSRRRLADVRAKQRMVKLAQYTRVVILDIVKKAFQSVQR
jgi:hypothetical protein